MKNFVILFSFFLILGTSCTSVAADKSLSQAARTLNKQAKSSIGVSVPALQFLFNAGPGTLLLKDSLVQDGSWPYLQELESAGYIKKKIVQSADGDFVQTNLTVKGLELRDALSGP